MANLNGFDANQVEPNETFEPIPAGRYIAAITDSQLKPTKRGDGKFLELEFTIIEGQYKGRKLWDRLCIDHPNPTTVRIARGKLSAICRAVGILTPKDSVELHNIPLVIKVKCKRRNDTDDIVNEISGYTKKQPSAISQQAPVESNTPPWRR